MLNEAQQKAVDSNNKRIVCLAGAGTGKSTTLLARISRLVSEGVKPEHILALTFTNAAAFEMKDRYLKDHKGSDKIPEFRTFHSFCYHILTIDPTIRMKLGYSSIPSIAEPAAEKRIITEAKMQTGIKLSDKKIFEKSTLTQQEAYDLMLILKAADRLMKQRNLITFDKLCSEVCNLFVADDPLIAQYKKQFVYVFADEYQDSDKCQHEFVLSFKDSHIFVVGDALQNLYAFRGTSSEMIKALAEDADWETIKLYENYRSTKSICDYANKYSKSYAKESYRIAIESTKDTGASVTVEHYYPEYRGTVPESLVDLIVSHNSTTLTGVTAVLVRTNAEVASIQARLRETNTPFMSKRTTSNAHNLLKSVFDDTYAAEWLATYLSAELYSEFIRRSAVRKQQNAAYSLSEFIEEFGTNSEIKLNVDKLYRLRKVCRASTSIAAKQRDILRILGYDNSLKIDVSDAKKLSDVLDKLADELESYSSDACRLYVGTVHSVKGLEYDNVYVIGPKSRSWPLNIEDNQNLFYVAVTRAKTNLFIYFAG